MGGCCFASGYGSKETDPVRDPTTFNKLICSEGESGAAGKEQGFHDSH